jgi:hypothetical protein
MGFKIEKSFRLSDNQLLVEEAANYICSEALLNRPFYCNAYYLPMILEKRVEMKSEFQGLSEIKKWKPTSGSILVWDSYFAVTDAEVTDTYIEQNLKVRQLKRFKNQDSTYNLKIYEVLE